MCKEQLLTLVNKVEKKKDELEFFSHNTAVRKDEDALSKVMYHNMHFMKDVATQLSSVVTKLSSDDERKESEKEQALLLSISNEIAALRKREDLFRIVNLKLKELFAIDEFIIAQINEDRKTYSAFILDLEEPIKTLPDFENITSDVYHISDPLFSKVMQSEDLLLFNVDELATRIDMPAYVYFWHKAGIPYVVCMALRAGGIQLGCAYLHMNAPAISNLKKHLLKGICAQLSGGRIQYPSKRGTRT
jgi:hypothetical protein